MKYIYNLLLPVILIFSAITSNAQTGHIVPLNEFDTLGIGQYSSAMAWQGSTEWFLESNFVTQTAVVGTFHGKDNVLKIDLTNKICWAGLWYNCPEINVDKHRYLSYDIYIEGSSFVGSNGQTHTYFWDDGWNGSADRNLSGAHIERKNVAVGEWKTVVMDYHEPDMMDNNSGNEINTGKIQKILINYASDFGGASDNGTVYLANICLGSAVPDSIKPLVTPSCNIDSVPDQVHSKNPGMQTILLTGITDGGNGTVTPTITAKSNNPLFVIPSVSDVDSAGTAPLTYFPTPDIDSAKITLTVSATGSIDKKITFNIYTVPDDLANNAPTIDKVYDIQHNNNDGEQTITLTGISDGDSNTQHISINAVSSDTSVVSGVSVDYTSPDTSATLYYTPGSNHGDSATIFIIVKDDGGKTNGGIDEIQITFVVTIQTEVYKVSFTIVDTDYFPLQDAIVETGGYTDTTDANGSVTFFLPEGQYPYAVDLEGYQTYFDKVKVIDGNVNSYLSLESTSIPNNNYHELIIYPNPANEKVNVVFPQSVYDNIIITNMLGETVLIKKLKLQQKKTTINVNNWEAGIYIISLQNEQKHARFKFIIE